MLGLTSAPQVTLGAVLAAAIAGVFGILSLVIAKEQKVSDFRHAWVEELRSDISRFVAHARLFRAMVLLSGGRPHDEDALTAVRAELVAMFDAATRIRLRLDRSDPEALAVLDGLKAIEATSEGEASLASADIDRLEQGLVDDARKLMSRERRRVRKGEAIYRTAKALAVVTTCGLLAGAYWILLR